MKSVINSAQIYQQILELAGDEGLYASSRNEVYGCVFGRDSALTILKILRVCSRNNNGIDSSKLLKICKTTLLTLVSLQGKETNIESGEEPGKFIHEFRKSGFERLLKLDPAWYVYPDGYLRNYDSLDSTPLALIAIYKYWQLTRDGEFLLTVLPAVEAGLNWIITYGDRDKDYLLEYELPKERRHGGLIVQSWTDSHESIRRADGTYPLYPIAPVEVQGDAWLALQLWSDFYADHSPDFSRKLSLQAQSLKNSFNKLYLYQDGDLVFASQFLDGDKNQIRTVTGNPLLLLASTYFGDGRAESILNSKYVPDIVARSFCQDMFDPGAGIRTMSSQSKTYDSSQQSYHNGAFWPMLNTRSIEGLINWGYKEQAERLSQATLKPIEYFGSPIELYTKSNKGEYLPYLSPSGQTSCMIQAWSAAGILDLLTA